MESRLATTKSSTDLATIVELQNEYYSDKKKSVLFKHSQKMECASLICSRMDLADLMDQTFWIVPNKNQIYMEYRAFKLYGHPDVYSRIVETVLEFCDWCVAQYGHFEMHVNIASLTISAIERYRSLIVRINEECIRRQKGFLPRLASVNLYNVTATMDNVMSILLQILPPELGPKIKLYKKDESGPLLEKLHADSGKIYTP
jgi:hypothetical protein